MNRDERGSASKRTRGLARLVVSAALLSGAACRKPAVDPPKGLSPELEPLYEAIHDFRDDYEKGLEGIVAGDPVTGENLLAAASHRLSVAAQLCSRMPKCDFDVFVQASEHVVLERRLAERLAVEGSEGDASGAEQGEGAGKAETEAPATVEAPPDTVRKIPPLEGADLKKLIPLNQPVMAALNDWLTWNRPALMEAYENYQFLREKIVSMYEEARLPEALLFAIMAKETGGKVHAYSRAGAAGPLQFMRHTARRYGLGIEDGFDLRLDPVAATRASAAYLKDQFRLLSYDLEKVLAAYNVGEGRLQVLHRRHHGADFWDPRIRFAVPEETQEYVPQVLAAALLFLNPEEYGVRFPVYENTLTTVVLKEDISLNELAICLGPAPSSNGWFRVLRNLNPRANPRSRLGAKTSVEMPSMLVPVYAEQCLGDAPLAKLARGLHEAGYPARPEVIRYSVQQGDTLASIAVRFECDSVQELAKINGLRGAGDTLRVGQRLTIPR